VSVSDRPRADPPGERRSGEQALSAEQRALVRRAMPAVSRIARATARRSGAAYEDLRQIAAMALTEAARGYDVSRGLPLEAFAWKAVKGAMHDYLRRESAARPERILARVFAIEAPDLFEDGGDPFDEGDEERLEKVKVHCRAAALELFARFAGGAFGEASPPGEDGVIRALAIGALKQACAEVLDPEEAAIVGLHYGDGATWEQAAQAVGLSESTVKRRVAEIERKLGRRLREG
jgi:RNA polymerase sigma-B factor